MLIKIKGPGEVTESEVTSQDLYLDRRRFLRLGAGSLLTAAALSNEIWQPALAGNKLAHVIKGPYTVDEPLTPYESVTTYNNFYEFGTDKEDPSRLAASLKARPWKVIIDGEVARPGSYDIDDLIKPHTLQERVYRLRCVEAWSMVIPWVGVPLADLLKRFTPNSRAKFVRFETLYDPKQFPGQRRSVLDWPYIEGLRIDEAMHPLTLMAVGLYGEVLPNQNGAPLRLVVPWKYGFKSIKSIVRITLTEQMPVNTWARSAPDEYGFYANVNPQVDHPRWSQAKERRIGDYFKRETLMFNGYGAEVAPLYSGMNLRKSF
ncbi:MAG: protein-methionine-sulfoxide reductase catalytic subunit MsrP [Gammaproteobacteria bacterium]|nr:protein-methionine-sulfoxide reductase catalytic subunit MsrP [Gammaproteobacteria bacterium]